MLWMMAVGDTLSLDVSYTNSELPLLMSVSCLF